MRTHTRSHTHTSHRHNHAPSRTQARTFTHTGTYRSVLTGALRPLIRDMQVQTQALARSARQGLTLRSLCTTPIWWQWRTASRICWIQWLRQKHVH